MENIAVLEPELDIPNNGVDDNVTVVVPEKWYRFRVEIDAWSEFNVLWYIRENGAKPCYKLGESGKEGDKHFYIELKFCNIHVGNTFDIVPYLEGISPDTTIRFIVTVVKLPMNIQLSRIPGLNENATAIANDLAFGFGVRSGDGQVPLGNEYQRVQDYKRDYIESGFKEDNRLHRDYANFVRRGFRSKAIYTINDIRNMPTIIELMDKSDDFLFWSFRLLGNDFSFWSSVSSFFSGNGNGLQANIQSMIQKFQNNEGGVYTNAALTEAVRTNSSTEVFLIAIENWVTRVLRENDGNIAKLVDNTILTKRSRYNPSFGKEDLNNLFGGLTIAINDVWSYQVRMIGFSKENTFLPSYKIVCEIILWDHFGLDFPDMEKFSDTHQGFVAWFILQHFRGYRPFITKVKFNHTFNVTIY